MFKTANGTEPFRDEVTSVFMINLPLNLETKFCLKKLFRLPDVVVVVSMVIFPCYISDVPYVVLSRVKNAHKADSWNKVLNVFQLLRFEGWIRNWFRTFIFFRQCLLCFIFRAFAGNERSIHFHEWDCSAYESTYRGYERRKKKTKLDHKVRERALDDKSHTSIDFVICRFTTHETRKIGKL